MEVQEALFRSYNKAENLVSRGFWKISRGPKKCKHAVSFIQSYFYI